MLLVPLAWLFADDPIDIGGVRSPPARAGLGSRLSLALSMATLTAILVGIKRHFGKFVL